MRKKRWLMTFLVLMVLLMFPLSAQAKSRKHKNSWVEKKGYWYYYNEKGKKVTGLIKIGKRTYYFDTKGVQRTGWRKVGSKYYRFRKFNGAKGYMYKDCTREQIYIKKNGRASIRTAQQRRRVELLVKYALWADTFIVPSMNDQQKLYACMSELRKFRYRNEPDISFTGDWDIAMAEAAYERKDYGFATLECLRFACAFAYLVNAAYSNHVVILANTGHGWTSIRNVYYDATRTITRGGGYFPVADTSEYYVQFRKNVT